MLLEDPLSIRQGDLNSLPNLRPKQHAANLILHLEMVLGLCSEAYLKHGLKHDPYQSGPTKEPGLRLPEPADKDDWALPFCAAFSLKNLQVDEKGVMGPLRHPSPKMRSPHPNS